MNSNQSSNHCWRGSGCPTEMDFTSSIHVSGSHLKKTNIKATKPMRQFPAKLYALISITQRYTYKPAQEMEVTCSLIKEKTLDNKQLIKLSWLFMQLWINMHSKNDHFSYIRNIYDLIIGETLMWVIMHDSCGCFPSLPLIIKQKFLSYYNSVTMYSDKEHIY